MLKWFSCKCILDNYTCLFYSGLCCFLDKSCWRFGDLKWYFFCPREKKYASGARVNRATEAGYWKTSGKDRSVHYNGEVVGWIKTLIFHTGRPPRGERTDWVLHEYRLEDKGLADMGVPQVSDNFPSFVFLFIFTKILFSFNIYTYMHIYINVGYMICITYYTMYVYYPYLWVCY
jgi:hypothetical protein